ncbi:MAG: NmrA/HSCARG family protein [Candidatus Manganitrophus sp.]|nr:NmrA/HSCARG family protein [Candidatus Manganitrophus sp.]MDC4224735.1 NmrA/HSCARG family protein [Candidatus Manganitrophus sp.]WDT70325.1 MAG: NmrA/HSCARG family protein [Candidatus Manganitrophus sp.]
MAEGPILVTGATGQQGGIVARYLLQQGERVRALTRHPAKADALKKLGAEVSVGDLTDKASLQPALRGVQRVFLVTTPFEAGLEAEVRQGIEMVDAAQAAGVAHLVFSSVGSANKNTGIPHFETKGRVERHLRESGLPATILRPVFFMENFTAPWMIPAIQQRKVVLPLAPDRMLQMIALDDLGAFAAAAFLRPKEFLGQEIDLAGDALTMPEALGLLGKEIGAPIQYEQLPIDQAEQRFGQDAAMMYRWFNEVGYNVDISALEKRWAIPLTKFRELVTTEAYQRRLQPKAA